MIESEHFQYQIIPAGRWSRLEGTTARGGTDEPRPHLVPKTDMARKLVAIDAGGFIGSTGLCPGNVILDGGEEITAYRFIDLPEDVAADMMVDLDAQIANLQRAAQD